MELLRNPSDPSLMALDINDGIKFLHLETDSPLSDVLTRDDYSIEKPVMSSLPQPVDSSVVKCLAWCSSTGDSSANALAAGLSSGKVVLLWPSHHAVGVNAFHRKEFIPHAARACNSLSWNDLQPNLLAAGLERNRSENSLIIWDMVADLNDGANQISNKNYPLEPTNSHSHTSNRRIKGNNFTKPLVETCFTEAVNSVLWNRHENKTLFAGIGSKQLRLYDLRNIRSVSSAVNTKAVMGICQDPLYEMRLASFYDNNINIWDLRKFTKPAASISTKYAIVKMEWCPSRSGLIASLTTGLSGKRIIHTYDMTHTTLTDSDPDIAYRHIEQIVKPHVPEEETICTFAWRHSSQNCLITITDKGNLHNVLVHERISLAWTKDSRLLSASDEIHICSEIQNQMDDVSKMDKFDMEYIMHKRALNGYGLRDLQHHDPTINLEPENTMLHELWKWIDVTKQLTLSTENQLSVINHYRTTRGMSQNGSAQLGSHTSRFAGLQSELQYELTQDIESSYEAVEWVGVPSVKHTIYSSPRRKTALEMCGWHCLHDIRKDDSLNLKFKNTLLECKNIEQAAAIALWHLDMRSAIDILQQGIVGSNSNYSVIAMALSGYSGNENVSPLWQEMCATLQKSMSNPYMRAAFAFLNSHENGQGRFNSIFNTKGLSIRDRTGFACMYLPDDQLHDVMELISESAAKEGDLGGVVITGLTSDRGIELVQTYVDKTKDVQTAVLALVQTKCKDILSNPKVLHMLEGYRMLLNMWTRWKERASLDIAVGSMNGTNSQRSKQMVQGVIVHCNFCSKSIKNTSRLMNIKGRGHLLQSPSMMSKVTSCPSCRKPLPRCSVCCMGLGTSPTDSGDIPYRHKQKDVDLDSWFTWCPLCQHGGHAKHLTVWFEEHQTCPYSGCMCKCSDLIFGLQNSKIS